MPTDQCKMPIQYGIVNKEGGVDALPDVAGICFQGRRFSDAPESKIPAKSQAVITVLLTIGNQAFEQSLCINCPAFEGARATSAGFVFCKCFV